jgi:hypothetical protein
VADNNFRPLHPPLHSAMMDSILYPNPFAPLVACQQRPQACQYSARSHSLALPAPTMIHSKMIHSKMPRPVTIQTNHSSVETTPEPSHSATFRMIPIRPHRQKDSTPTRQPVSWKNPF